MKLVKNPISFKALEGLHDPYSTRTGISTEAAGNALLLIGYIFIANLAGHLPPCDGIGRAHGLTEMTVPALAAGKTAVSFAFHIGAAFYLRQIMLCGECSQIDQLLIKRHPFFPLDL